MPKNRSRPEDKSSLGLVSSDASVSKQPAKLNEDSLSKNLNESEGSALGITSQPQLTDSISISRQWIMENKGAGINCPTCDRKTQENHFPISKSMALALKTMYMKHGKNLCNPRDLRTEDDSDLADKNHSIPKMAHWRLVKQTDHTRRKGNWQITEHGAAWIDGLISIPKEIITYQGELTSQSKEVVLFEDVAGTTSGESTSSSKHESPQKRTYEDATSSDPMYNSDTLASRRSKISPSANEVCDSPADLFHEITSESDRIEVEPLDPRLYSGDGNIDDARKWLEANLEKGVYCPTCDKLAVYHKYKMTDYLGMVMIEIYHRSNTETPIQTSDLQKNKKVVDRRQQVSMLARRGLLEKVTTPKGKRGNWYQMTPAGIEWVNNMSTTPDTLISFNRYNRTLQNGGLVTIKQVFDGSKEWNYKDLMEGRERKDLFPL